MQKMNLFVKILLLCFLWNGSVVTGQRKVDELLHNLRKIFSSVEIPKDKEINIGHQCFTHQGNTGYCDIVSSCPPQFRALHLLENYKSVREYFRLNLCRKDFGEVFFCCPSKSYIPSALFTEIKGSETLLDPLPIEDEKETQNKPNNKECEKTKQDEQNEIDIRFKSQNLGSSIIQNPSIPSRDECGTFAIASRIIGGKARRLSNEPWIAALGAYGETSFLVYCGGALISDQYVLTTNCFDFSKSPTHVRLGDYDIESKSDGAIPHDYHIVEVIEHRFIKHTYENNVFLVKLDRKVQFNDKIRPGCLPFDFGNSTLENEKLLVAGWGYRQPGNVVSAIPYADMFPVVPLDKCKEAFNESDVSINSKIICLNTDKSAPCRGDEGTPVHVLDKTRNKWIIVGLHSNSGCEVGIKPAVATRISYYLPWILANIK